MNRKLLIGIISSILVIGGVVSGSLFLRHQEKIREERKQSNGHLKDDLKIGVNTEVKLLSLVKNKDKLVNILSKDELIDTTILGEKEVVIEYEVEKEKREKKFKIIIIDTVAPTIEYSKELSTTEGSEIDLLKDVKVSDNSMEEISATVEGEYDFNKEGTYHLKYVVSDSSNNQVEEEFTLTVNKKPAVKNPNSAVSQSNASFTTTKGFEGKQLLVICMNRGILDISL